MIKPFSVVFVTLSLFCSLPVLAAKQQFSQPSQLTVKLLNKSQEVINPTLEENKNVQLLTKLKPIPAGQSMRILLQPKNYRDMLYLSIRVGPYTKLGLATWNQSDFITANCKSGVIYGFNKLSTDKYPVLKTSTLQWNTCQAKTIIATYGIHHFHASY